MPVGMPLDPVKYMLQSNGPLLYQFDIGEENDCAKLPPHRVPLIEPMIPPLVGQVGMYVNGLRAVQTSLSARRKPEFGEASTITPA
jgi:hypothetical protein